MIQQILPLLSRYIPAAVAMKGISKINPRLSSAIQAATGAGYTADAILDYLRNSMEPAGITQRRQQLAQGDAQGSLRPDEISLKNNLDDKRSGLGIPLAAAGAAGGIAGLFSGENEIPFQQEDDYEAVQQKINSAQAQAQQMQEDLNKWANEPVQPTQFQNKQNARDVAQQGIKNVLNPNKPSLMEQIIAANTPQPDQTQSNQKTIDKLAYELSKKNKISLYEAKQIIGNQMKAKENIKPSNPKGNIDEAILKALENLLKL